MGERSRRRRGPPEDETPEAARERAQAASMRLLAHRSRSVAEMRERLARHELPEAVVEAEITRLEGLGLLDDDAFAQEKAASLVRRGVGPREVQARLKASGVEDAAGSAAGDALDAAGGEEAVARELVTRRYGDLSDADRRTRAKAAQFLVRRGFSGEVAGAVCGIFEDGEA